MAPHYDAAIIGTGQAGPSLANRLTQAGMKVVVHRAGPLRRHLRQQRLHPDQDTGCERLCRAHRRARRRIRRRDRRPRRHGHEEGQGAQGHGLRQLDEGRRDVAARDAELHDPARPWPPRSPRPRSRSAPERLTADKIFLNVGGRALVPKIPGIETVDYLTNNSIMNIDYAPRHLVILGGSYIGLEFAQIYRRFGSAVTVIEAAPRLVPREDEDISSAIKDILAGEGIVFHLEHKCTGLSKRGDAHRRPHRGPGRHLRDRRQRPPARHRPHSQHRRSRPRQGRRPRRSARLHRDRRVAAHQRAEHLGARRLQRPRRFHPHLLQRLRDRRGQSPRQRARAGSPTASRPMRSSSIRRSAASA